MISNLWDIVIALTILAFNGGGSAEVKKIRYRLLKIMCENTEYNLETLISKIESIEKNAMEYYECDIKKQLDIKNMIVADLIELKELYLTAF